MYCTRQEAELVVIFPDGNVACVCVCVWIEVNKSDESDTCMFSRAYNKLTSLQLMKMWLVVEIFQFILLKRGWPLHEWIYASISRQNLSVRLTFKKQFYQNLPNKMSDWKWTLNTSINYSPIPGRNIALQINGPYWIYIFILGPANYITGEYVLCACKSNYSQQLNDFTILNRHILPCGGIPMRT